LSKKVKRDSSRSNVRKENEEFERRKELTLRKANVFVVENETNYINEHMSKYVQAQHQDKSLAASEYEKFMTERHRTNPSGKQDEEEEILKNYRKFKKK